MFLVTACGAFYPCLQDLYLHNNSLSGTLPSWLNTDVTVYIQPGNDALCGTVGGCPCQGPGDASHKVSPHAFALKYVLSPSCAQVPSAPEYRRYDTDNPDGPLVLSLPACPSTAPPPQPPSSPPPASPLLNPPPPPSLSVQPPPPPPSSPPATTSAGSGSGGVSGAVIAGAVAGAVCALGKKQAAVHWSRSVPLRLAENVWCARAAC